jgi:hypothetical protein
MSAIHMAGLAQMWRTPVTAKLRRGTAGSLRASRRRPEFRIRLKWHPEGIEQPYLAARPRDRLTAP